MDDVEQARDRYSRLMQPRGNPLPKKAASPADGQTRRSGQMPPPRAAAAQHAGESASGTNVAPSEPPASQSAAAGTPAPARRLAHPPQTPFLIPTMAAGSGQGRGSSEHWVDELHAHHGTGGIRDGPRGGPRSPARSPPHKVYTEAQVQFLLDEAEAKRQAEADGGSASDRDRLAAQVRRWEEERREAEAKLVRVLGRRPQGGAAADASEDERLLAHVVHLMAREHADEMRKLQARVDRLDALLAERNGEIERLRLAPVEDMGEYVAKLDQETTRLLKDDLLRVQRELKEKTVLLETAEERHAAERRTLREMVERGEEERGGQASALQGELKAKARQIAEMERLHKEELEAAEEERVRLEEDLLSRIERANQQVEAFARRMEDFSEMYRQLKQDRDVLKQALEERRVDRPLTRDEVGAMLENVKQLEEKLTREEELRDRDLKEHYEREMALQARIDAAGEEVEQARAQVARHEQEAQELAEELRRARDEDVQAARVEAEARSAEIIQFHTEEAHSRAVHEQRQAAQAFAAREQRLVSIINDLERQLHLAHEQLSTQQQAQMQMQQAQAHIRQQQRSSSAAAEYYPSPPGSLHVPDMVARTSSASGAGAASSHENEVIQKLATIVQHLEEEKRNAVGIISQQMDLISHLETASNMSTTLSVASDGPYAPSSLHNGGRVTSPNVLLVSAEPDAGRPPRTPGHAVAGQYVSGLQPVSFEHDSSGAVSSPSLTVSPSLTNSPGGPGPMPRSAPAPSPLRGPDRAVASPPPPPAQAWQHASPPVGDAPEPHVGAFETPARPPAIESLGANTHQRRPMSVSARLPHARRR